MFLPLQWHGDGHSRLSCLLDFCFIVNLADGFAVPLASLWMIAASGERSVCWRAGLLWVGPAQGGQASSWSSKKGKCKILCFEWNKPTQQDCLGADLLESSFAEKGPVLLVQDTLNMNQQCVLATKRPTCMLGCVGKSVASRLWKVILSL